MMIDMQLVAAAVLLALTGIVHSVLGEWMVFRRKQLRAALGQQWGIVWATWHIPTALGLAFALWLAWLAIHAPTAHLLAPHRLGLQLFALGLGGSAALVARATRGRHPGWLAMGLTAALLASA
jgi:hypothetical protein